VNSQEGETGIWHRIDVALNHMLLFLGQQQVLSTERQNTGIFGASCLLGQQVGLQPTAGQDVFGANCLTRLGAMNGDWEIGALFGLGELADIKIQVYCFLSHNSRSHKCSANMHLMQI